MYKPRTRPAAHDALPPMKKKFAIRSFKCTCNRQVKVGELVYVDGLNNRLICLPCGTLSSKSNVVPVVEPDDWQKGHDRMRALENLPAPLKPTLQNELDSLKKQFSMKPNRFCEQSTEKDEWLHGVYNKVARPCARCNTWQKVGRYVAFHRARKFIVCSECLKHIRIDS